MLKAGCETPTATRFLWVCMCACFSAAVQGGDLVRDPRVSPPSQYCPPIFIFTGSGASERMFPQQLIVTWAAKGNNCSSYLMCFCASSAFVPFNESKEGKNTYQLVGVCVCVSVGTWWGWIPMHTYTVHNILSPRLQLFISDLRCAVHECIKYTNPAYLNLNKTDGQRLEGKLVYEPFS